MKIVVGVDGRAIAPYFGKSERFLIFEVRDGRVVSDEAYTNPGHTRKFSPPKYIADMGVAVVIGGIVGRIAYGIMRRRGIEVIAGASGDALAAIENYLKGSLTLDQSAIETRENPQIGE